MNKNQAVTKNKVCAGPEAVATTSVASIEADRAFAIGQWYNDLDQSKAVRSRLHMHRMKSEMSVSSSLIADGHLLLKALDSANLLIEQLMAELYGPSGGG